MSLTTIICVDAPTRTADKIRERIRLCVEQTGDDLIGTRVYEDGSETLVVKLAHHDYIPKHQIVLGPALQAGAILGFTFRICLLVKLQFASGLDMSLMETFPCRNHEFWFPSIDEPDVAYLSLQTREMSREQGEWIRHLVRISHTQLATEGVPPGEL